MAGGLAGDTRAPFPKDRIIWFKFGPFEVIASKSADFIVEKFQLPFSFIPKQCFQTAQDVVVANAITINIVDDSSTPKQVVTDQAVAAITGGAGSWVEVTMASITQTLFAGSLIEVSYASGASDTAEGLVIYLFGNPVH